MKIENFFFFIIILFCSFSFLGFSIWCFISQNPVHFYAGSKILNKSITNIKKYNISNGLMWAIYSVSWFVDAFLGLLNISIGAIGCLVCCAGVFILIFAYSKILKKYTLTGNTN